MFKVILADTQDVFRIGLARVLAGQNGLRIVAHASDRSKVDSAISAHPESIVVVSISLIDELTEFVAGAREALCRVLLISDDLKSLHTHRSAGVAGVVARDTPPEAFIECVRRIVRGMEFAWPQLPKAQPDMVGIRAASNLLPGEKRVIALLMQGLKNRGIAERLASREQVVKNKLQSIYDKTGCSTRVELALYVAHHPDFAAAINQCQETFCRIAVA
jgi:DNA-binding NarL/FixJ family response regulator